IAKNEVLRDCNFTIPRGSIFGIFGVNGSGKSTLVNCFASLLAPDEGQILVHGKDIRALGHQLGSILKKCSHREVYRAFTAMENIGFLARLYNLDPIAAESAAHKLLNMLGVSREDQYEKLASRLSLGTRGKVALVCSLLPLLQEQDKTDNPPILLLDEPTIGLDVISVEHFFAALRSLRDWMPSLTVIIASNDPREAAFCEDYVTLANGHNKHEPQKLQHLKRSITQAKQSLADFAGMLGLTLTNGTLDSSRDLTERLRIPAGHLTPAWSALNWRSWIDLKRHPLLSVLVIISLVIPNMIALFASAGTRGTWPAMVMTALGIYITLLTREFQRLYDRERGWYGMIETIVTAPISRTQHILVTSLRSWVLQTCYTAAASLLLIYMLRGQLAGELPRTLSGLDACDWLTLLVVFIGTMLAAQAIGLSATLLPFTMRQEQAYFLVMMVPTLSVLCGGIFYPPDTLPPAFAWLTYINPIAYGAAAYAECLGIGVHKQLPLTGLLINVAGPMPDRLANVIALYALTAVYLGLAAWLVRSGERLLRRIGRLRHEVQ
ncbi:MAG TPA: ATP-binding cassette domain-containing protein, partial [Oligoflexia bacterium]|nr:ATP-binding cassette domain-containing protein [Oligoflexia bacterium]